MFDALKYSRVDVSIRLKGWLYRISLRMSAIGIISVVVILRKIDIKVLVLGSPAVYLGQGWRFTVHLDRMVPYRIPLDREPLLKPKPNGGITIDSSYMFKVSTKPD